MKSPAAQVGPPTSPRRGTELSSGQTCATCTGSIKDTCGDEVLWRVARALQRHSPHVYHLFADKFTVNADSLEDAGRIASVCWRELAWQWIGITIPDGGRRVLRGVFLWGVLARRSTKLNALSWRRNGTGRTSKTLSSGAVWSVVGQNCHTS
jgi:hypothetical protein